MERREERSRGDPNARGASERQEKRQEKEKIRTFCTIHGLKLPPPDLCRMNKASWTSFRYLFLHECPEGKL